MADPMQFRRAGHERECPICGHRGRFWSHGTPPRGEAMCPRCLSLERHRLMHLLIDRHGADLLEGRSKEHTSELQSLMRISYAVFCLKKKKQNKTTRKHTNRNRQHRKERTKTQQMRG